MKMTVGKVREAAEETEVDTEEIKEEEIKEVEAEEVEDRGETEMKNLDIWIQEKGMILKKMEHGRSMEIRNEMSSLLMC